MKVLISQARYDRFTAGMGPAQRRAFDQVVEVRPEPALFHHDREGAEPDLSVDWVNLGDLVDELTGEEREEQARRFFLNQLVVAHDAPPGIVTAVTGGPTTWQDATADPITLEALREFMRRWATTPTPPSQRLEAGDNALAVFATAPPPRSPRGWPKDTSGAAGALADLTGIPIVRNPDLQPDDWQLVDATTGEVLYEGTIRASLGEYIAVIREYAEQVADDAGLPRHILTDQAPDQGDA